MQSLFSLFAKSSNASAVRAPQADPHAACPAAGPQELDAQQLQLVSGGLPKGGWGAPEASATTSVDGLPKGGW